MRFLGKALTAAATTAAVSAAVLSSPANATPDPGPVPAPLNFDFDSDGIVDEIEPFTTQKTLTNDVLTCTVSYTSGASDATTSIDFDIALHLSADDPQAMCPMATSGADFEGTGDQQVLMIWPQMQQRMTGPAPKPAFITVDATGTVTNRWLFPDHNGYAYESTYFATDIDGDADSDVLIAHENLWTVYRNDGNGTFTLLDRLRGDQIIWGDFDTTKPGVEALSYGYGYDPYGPLTYIDFTSNSPRSILAEREGCHYVWERYAHNHLAPLRYTDNGNLAVDLRSVCDIEDDNRAISLISDGTGGFTLGDKSDDVSVVVPSVARRDRVTMYEDRFEKADINVLGNDTAPDGVTVTVTMDPRIGTATALENGRVRYDRRGKGTAPDSFEYTISDANGYVSTAIVYIKVVPEAEVAARNDRVRFIEGRFEKAAINVLGNDKIGNGVTVSIKEQPSIGAAKVLSNGRIWYDRTGKGTQRDIFWYTITGTDGSQSTARVVIDVSPK